MGKLQNSLAKNLLFTKKCIPVPWSKPKSVRHVGPNHTTDGDGMRSNMQQSALKGNDYCTTSISMSHLIVEHCRTSQGFPTYSSNKKAGLAEATRLSLHVFCFLSATGIPQLQTMKHGTRRTATQTNNLSHQNIASRGSVAAFPLGCQ